MSPVRRGVLEGSVLFISILKWIFLASVAGALVGLSTTVFLKLLGWSIASAKQYQYYFLLLPLALFISAVLVKYLAPDAEGHGTEKVIEAVHRKSGKIDLKVVPVKLLATISTIALGGSAGKEGPCAQIGAGVCSGLASLFRFDARDRKKLVICGISAGFASVFGTPIAGAIFGVEVLFVGAILYDVLLPSFVAGIVAFQVASAFGITYFHDPVNFLPVFSSAFFLKVCLGGIFFGICSLLLIEILKMGEEGSRRIKWQAPYKGLLGGAMLAVMALLFSTNYLGLGLDTVREALEGGDVAPESFILKMIFTAVTLSFGGSGGIITPIFFVGATAGNVFGRIPGFDPVIFSALGMVGVLAGAANTPISASILAIEMFGPEIAPYAAVASVISFLMTGHRSVYPSQVLSLAKSASLRVREGSVMGDIEGAEIKLRSKSVSGGFLRAFQLIRKKRRK